MIRDILIVTLIVCCAILGCCLESHSQTNPPVASQWDIRYSTGYGAHPTAMPGGWSIPFNIYTPKNGKACENILNSQGYSICPSVNYITVPYFTGITGSSISMTFSIAAGSTTVFDWHTNPDNTACAEPATVRFMLEHTGDSALTDIQYRWWSWDVSYVLEATPGSVTITAPLLPAQWSNVNGQNGSLNATTEAGFASVLAHPGAIGMTFGGGCYYSHGVFIDSGDATFMLTNFRINP
jgi:hypothetical protein